MAPLKAWPQLLIMTLWFMLAMPFGDSAAVVRHKFTVGAQKVKRLCKEQSIVTVNGQFPGPTIYIYEGDTLRVEVENQSKYNVTIHWHGIRQLRSCWADGPAYVTQCPIVPGTTYVYKFTTKGQEGTLWWHAHISWLRATVYGALVIYPRIGRPYPFPKPSAEVPILLGEWWNANVEDVIKEAISSGGAANESDAFTVNSQPGDLFSCSKEDTFRVSVESGKTYLLRMVNAGLNRQLFFTIAKHKMTVVAVDASYTKPYKTKTVLISPGQTTDVLLKAKKSSGKYYMAARVYNSAPGIPFNNSTTTATLDYKSHDEGTTSSNSNSLPVMPLLPAFNDTPTAFKFITKLRSLKASVPQTVNEEMLITIGLGLHSCPSNSCAGPNGQRLVGSMNNFSFVLPQNFAMLQALFHNISGVFTKDFPDNPPLPFNYTSQNLPASLLETQLGTRVKVLKFNSTVQVVLQGTGLVTIESHPIHIHGFDFYVIGQGFGNYNPEIDPLDFNLVDPQMRNTIAVPTGGWAAIRFIANNPGIWLMHCHLDSHSIVGLTMAFLVENGAGQSNTLPPPPLDLPKC